MLRRVVIAGLLIAMAGCDRSDLDAAANTATVSAHRGPVRISIAATPDEALAGERITVRIEATTDPGSRLQTPMIPDPADGRIGEFDVLELSLTQDIAQEDGSRTWSQSLIVDCLAAGSYDLTLPPITFDDDRATTPRTGRIELDPIPIVIRSSHEDEFAQMHDIHGWIDIPGGPWWPWILAIGGFVAGVGALGIWAASRTRPTGPPPSPAEMARAALGRLASRGDLQKGNVDAFYTSLSDIIRQYIEGRFALNAPRKTTAEFLGDAERDARLNESQRSHLRTFLRVADLVKFAGHTPPTEQGSAALEEAARFIDGVEESFAADLETNAVEVAPC
ncbi:MAG: hypothetical protein GY894_05140 [Planctomycetes bacterium]|jgi:hypothetical protein|nr:hypothetical protein [Planctomycetota bacterium]MCP4838732.1 hypothetical protein [Planctomycetota bacterium]